MTIQDFHIWRPIARPDFGFVDAMSESIRMEEWRNPSLLTSLRYGPTLLVACDYAGNHQNSQFQSLSFLLVDLQYTWYWEEIRTELRLKHLRDNRRICYKKLNSDKRRANALIPFLRAANSIPGLLMTFLIDKRIQTLFKKCDENSAKAQSIVAEDLWNPKTFEKLLRVAHLGAFLVSGMVGSMQNVLWVTDQDEIVPDDARHVAACKLIGHILNHYLNCSIGHFRLATTRSDDGTLQIEDIAALPDLAAGCMAELGTSLVLNGAISADGLFTPLSRSVPQKARAIGAWLAEKTHTLKKEAFLITHVPPDEIKSKRLRVCVEYPVSEFDFRPEMALRLGRIPHTF